MEAIYIASPNLYKKLNAFVHQQPFEPEKLDFSYIRYYTRMASRSTPFGLFAQCGCVNWGEDTSKIILDPEDSVLHARLDNLVAHKILQQIIPLVQDSLIYFPNTTLYLLHDELRYVEYDLIENQRKYKLSAVEATDILKDILNFCETGALLADINKMLVESYGVDFEESTLYLQDLIKNQLLVSQLEPTITGEECLPQVIKFLEGSSRSKPFPALTTLRSIETCLNSIKKGTNTIPEQGPAVVQKIRDITFDVSEDKLFQIDSVFALKQQNILNNRIQSQLIDAMSVLNALTEENSQFALERFMQRFLARYENREMPLAEALDSETGVGYIEENPKTLAPLLDGLVLSKTDSKEQIIWNKNQKWCWDLLQNARFERAYSVEITDQMVQQFSAKGTNLPPSISVIFRIINNGQLFLEGAGGVSASNLINRFAHADLSIRNLAREICDQEQCHNPDVVFAEIVHLPESRIGNILFHPGSRDYEIPYLAASSVDRHKQLNLLDLMVSVVNRRIVLRSKKLNKEIIPRLSSAYNYTRSDLPVYRFLCDLQNQGLRTSLNFSWGSLESQYKFLPRVVYKDVILHPATWRFEKEDLASFNEIDDSNFMSTFQAFQDKWQIPRYWILAEGDNELFVDSENEYLLKSWWDLAKKRNQVLLKEYFHPDEKVVVSKQGLSHANQFIASLIKKEKTYVSGIINDEISKGFLRTFTPGSEWLYYKVYCGPSISDRILTEVLYPAVRLLNEQGMISEWFFIRYADPDAHLRIRFHLKDTSHFQQVLETVRKLLRPFETSGLLGKVQLDTYQRELERYGFQTIAEAEALFCFDSMAALEFLLATEGDAREEIRWLWTLRSVDSLLDDFKFPLETKLMILQQMKNSFAAEFDIKKQQKLQIDKKFRTHREKIDQMLSSEVGSSPDWASLLKILHQRSKQNFPIANKLRSKERQDQITVPLNDLIKSYIHMVVNRLIPSHQRLHEMVQYDFLFKYYRSLSAQNKSRNAGSSVLK